MLQAVQDALWDARKTAGMSVGPRPMKPSKANSGRTQGSPGWLGRLRDLVADQEPDPCALLCAVARAVVDKQAARTDSPKHREGAYAKGTTITRDEWWEGNLGLGRKRLAIQQQPTRPVRSPPETIDGEPLTAEERKIWLRAGSDHGDRAVAFYRADAALERERARVARERAQLA